MLIELVIGSWSSSLLAVLFIQIQQAEEGENAEGIEPVEPDDDAQDATSYNEGDSFVFSSTTHVTPIQLGCSSLVLLRRLGVSS